MSINVKISEETVKAARQQSAVANRSMGAQIDYWAKLGRLVELYPGLTFDFLQKLMRENRLDQLQKMQEEEPNFNALSLNTLGYQFDRDEANAR